jgi:hypothetical protein
LAIRRTSEEVKSMASCADHCAELVCVPTALAPEERTAHFALIRQVFGELVLERTELTNGYAYRFEPDALKAVARFVANERKCCPFLDFELAIIAGSGPIWLRMTGPSGTREVLEAELAISSSVSS